MWKLLIALAEIIQYIFAENARRKAVAEAEALHLLKDKEKTDAILAKQNALTASDTDRLLLPPTERVSGIRSDLYAGGIDAKSETENSKE